MTTAPTAAGGEAAVTWPPTPPFLAYQVTEPSESHARIVFAVNAKAARRAGAAQLDWDGDGKLTCERVSWADRYAQDGRVPAAACVAAGWWFEGCFGCDRRIDEDSLAERRLSSRNVIGWQGGRIYCCKTCKEQDERTERRCKRVETAFLAQLRERLRKRFPEAEVVREHVYVPRGYTPAVVEQVVIDFTWPGQKIGPAQLRLDRAQSHRIQGPRPLVFMCCMGDRDAFEAYAAATKRPSNPVRNLDQTGA